MTVVLRAPGGLIEEIRSPRREKHLKPFLVWREEWTLQVDFMDEDHRLLVDILNCIAERFCASLQSGADNGDWRLNDMLAALGQHTREHFNREEMFMREIDYPDYCDHKWEHGQLVAEFAQLTRELRTSGVDLIDREALEGLKSWLMGHLIFDDTKLASYALEHLGHGDTVLNVGTRSDAGIFQRRR